MKGVESQEKGDEESGGVGSRLVGDWLATQCHFSVRLQNLQVNPGMLCWLRGERDFAL